MKGSDGGYFGSKVRHRWDGNREPTTDTTATERATRAGEEVQSR